MSLLLECGWFFTGKMESVVPNVSRLNLGLFTVVASWTQEGEKHSRGGGLGSELACYHFCHILLYKANHKVGLDLRTGKIDSLSGRSYVLWQKPWI